MKAKPQLKAEAPASIDELVSQIDLRKTYKWSENPLVEPTEVTTRNKTVAALGTGHMVDTITGEVRHGTAIVVRKKVDTEQFVKVFADGVKASFDLSASGDKVFKFILNLMQSAPPATDRLYLHFMDAAEDPHFPMSDKTFWRGVKELMAKKFIAASNRPNQYWINPHLFFNGDRVAFMTEFVREGREERRQREIQSLIKVADDSKE